MEEIKEKEVDKNIETILNEIKEIPVIWEKNFPEVLKKIMDFWESKKVDFSPSSLDIEDFVELFFEENNDYGNMKDFSDDEYLKIMNVMDIARKKSGFVFDNFHAVFGSRPD